MPTNDKSDELKRLAGKLRDARVRMPIGCGYAMDVGDVIFALEELTKAPLSADRPSDGPGLLATRADMDADMWRLHARSFDAFLNELYAVMVDPCAEGSIKRDDMMAALKAAALRDREKWGNTAASSVADTKPDSAWLPPKVRAAIKRVSDKVMNASLLESDLRDLAILAMDEAPRSATRAPDAVMEPCVVAFNRYNEGQIDADECVLEMATALQIVRA